jgi:hypothetical protein
LDCTFRLLWRNIAAMKKPVSRFLAVLLVSAFSAAAGDAPRGLVVTPGADAADAEAAAAYILANTDLLATVGGVPLAGGEKQVTLFRDPEAPIGAIDVAAGTATLNLAVLERDGADPAQTRRRAGQALLRHLAVLLNEPPCPFPLCVLTTGCIGTDCLDEISANYCPPCCDRISRTAAKLGMAMQPTPGEDAEDAEKTESAQDL